MKHSLYILFVLFLLGTSPLLAQRAPSISSPEVHPDNTVTFRYYSRTAQKVSVSGELLTAPQQLTKDTSGIWSVTVGPN
jgi:enterochelin esterase family protein